MYPNVPNIPIPCLRPKMFSKEISILSWGASEPRPIHGELLRSPDMAGPATNDFSFSASTFDSGPRQVQHGSPRAVTGASCHEDPWCVSRCFKMLQGMNCASSLAQLVQHFKTIQVESLPLAFDEFVWMCDVCVWLESCTKLGVRTVQCDKPRSHSKSCEVCTLLHR